MEQERPAVPEQIKERRHRWYWLVAAVVLMTLAAVWAVKACGGGENGTPLPSFECRSHADMVVMGGGRVDCRFWAEGGQSMDAVGALSIRIYESADGEDWSLERTCRYTDYPFLMDRDTDSHQGQISVYGTPGRYYKAWVIVWAEGEAGSQSRSIWTQVVQA